MKKFICALFLFMMLCGMVSLTGCKENEGLTDEELTQIKAVYTDRFRDPGEVDVYYGKYNGYIVFEMFSVLPAERLLVLGNQYFLFSSSNELWTFKDNTLVELEKVYDRGDLNDKDIEKIHKRYLLEMKKSVNDYDKWYENYQEKVESYRNSNVLSEQLKSYWSGRDTKDIKEVWENQKGGSCKMDYKLGKYNYSFVFVEVGTKEESRTIKVADYDFTYSKDFTIWVYKDRDIIIKEEFITLEEAYTRGYLTKNDLQEIHALFVESVIH